MTALLEGSFEHPSREHDGQVLIGRRDACGQDRDHEHADRGAGGPRQTGDGRNQSIEHADPLGDSAEGKGGPCLIF